MPRQSLRHDEQTGEAVWTHTFYVVDLSDRSAPRAVGSFAVEARGDHSKLGNVVQTDHALIVGREQGTGTQHEDGSPQVRLFYDVFELSNPAEPTLASSFELPAGLAQYGHLGTSGCIIDLGWGLAPRPQPRRADGR